MLKSDFDTVLFPTVLLYLRNEFETTHLTAY